MNQPEVRWQPNPHLWRKMKQAERNMIAGMRRKHCNHRRCRYWARLYEHYLDRILAL